MTDGADLEVTVSVRVAADRTQALAAQTHISAAMLAEVTRICQEHLGLDPYDQTCAMRVIDW